MIARTHKFNRHTLELTPRQLFSLSEMGIPVWEFRSAEPEEKRAVIEKIVPIEPSEQLLNCDWIILIDGQNYSEQARQLLLSMLFSIGIEQNQVAIIDSDQLAPLQNVPSQKKVLFVLGEHLAHPLRSETMSRGAIHQALSTNITTVVSFSLDELLTSPMNKALAWQDLQLAKQALVQ